MIINKSIDTTNDTPNKVFRKSNQFVVNANITGDWWTIWDRQYGNYVYMLPYMCKEMIYEICNELNKESYHLVAKFDKDFYSEHLKDAPIKSTPDGDKVIIPLDEYEVLGTINRFISNTLIETKGQLDKALKETSDE